MNVAQDPNGLAYRISDGRVVWEIDPVRMHADDAFKAELKVGSESSSRGAERREASEWIREQLANGPVPSNQMIADAKENGIAERTLRRALKEMGGQSKKDGDKWVWCLPDQDGQ